MKLLWISSLIIFGVGLSILADFFLKKSGFSEWRFILIGFLLYGAVAFPVALAFKFTNFGVLFLIWEAAMVIGGLIIATFVFKEPFTIYRFVALVLALGALFLSYK